MNNFKKCNFIVLTILFIFVFCTSVFAYNDLDQNHWAFTAVEAMRLRDILHGYPDGNFYPEKNVTREEFAKIVVNTLGLTEIQATLKYEDVEETRWSKEFIDIGGRYFTAYKMGDKYFFKPEDASLREDVIVTTVLALGLENVEYNLDILNQFSDKQTITPSLEKYIAIAVQNDLIHGNPDGTLNPQGRLTRAEVAQFMYNILVKLEGGELIKIPVVEEIENEETLLDFETNLTFSPQILSGKTMSNYPFIHTVFFETKNELISANVHVINANGDIVGVLEREMLEHGIWLNSALKPAEEYKIVFKGLEDDKGQKYKDFEVTFKTDDDKLPETNEVFDIKIDIPRDENGLLKSLDVNILGNLPDSQSIQIIVRPKSGKLSAYVGTNTDRKSLLDMLENYYKDGDELTVSVYLYEYKTGKEKEIDVFSKTFYIDLKDDPEYVPEEVVVQVENVNIEHSNLHISLASTYTLKAIVTPDNATNKKVTWLSSDPTIAEIDENGNITPKAVGDVIITAESVNGKKDTMPLEIYTLRYKSKELEIGQVERIVHGADKLKDFKSSNEKVAIVSQTGYVTALSSGTTDITFKDNNNKELKCLITVKEPEIEVTGVSIGFSNLTMSLSKTRKFEAKVTPVNATNKTITWTSSDPKVATVDKDGNVVPNGVGKTTITATSANGKKSSCLLTIYTLKYESTIFEVGESECIAHGVEKLKDFKSSNTIVATVDQKGVVTALSGGETTITCRDNNGTEIKCVITVKDENAPVEPIVFKMTPDKDEFEVTETINLSVKSGTLQGSEAIIWEFEIDGTEIATNSGYSMKVSKIIDIGTRRYKGEIYGKEITLKAFPRDVRDNSDRETTEFKFIILKPTE